MYQYVMAARREDGSTFGAVGVTFPEAKTEAEIRNLDSFQLFPLVSKEGQNRFHRRQEDGRYKQGRSREFAAQLSPYVAGLIRKDEGR